MAKDFLTTFKADGAMCTAFEFDISDLDLEDREAEFDEAAWNQQLKGEAQLSIHKKVSTPTSPTTF